MYLLNYALTKSLHIEVKIFEAKMSFLPMSWHMYLVAHLCTFFGKTF